MAIDQSKLDALKSLASGGSAGLNAYRQAQQAEQASRTDALKGALGGQDVYQAAQKAQAQFAPNVGQSAFTDAANLQPAANQFLSEGASRLADQAYEAQQRLTLEAGKMQAANAKAQLQGAADQWAEAQRAALNPSGVQQTLGQRQALQNELAQMVGPAQGVGIDREQSIRLAQQAGQAITPEDAQFLSDVEAKRAQIAGVDEQTRAMLGQFAKAVGTDTKGFDEALARGDQGRVQELLNYLRPQAEIRGKQIETEGQKRLRELAPAFGIGELEAAGMFREGEGNDLTRAANIAKQQAYVAGTLGTEDEKKAARSAADQAGGLATGLSGARYKGLRESTGMSDEDILDTVQGQGWAPISEIAFDYVGKDRTKKTGVSGFRKEIEEFLKSNNVPEKQRQSMVKLATAYYSGQIAGTKSEAEEAE